MKTIHKYIFNESTTLELPKGAKVIKIDRQVNDICLWAIVNPSKDHPKEMRRFVSYGTGWQIPDSPNLEYVDTVSNNGFVWHWFEVKE